MSSHDRNHGPTYSKSRRSSPDHHHSQGVFFQTGLGGRTVLPPLSSAFPTSSLVTSPYPTDYTPRSSPSRYEVNQHLLYNYDSTTDPGTNAYPLYDPRDRYQSNAYNYTSRTSPIPSGTHPDHLKLAPLSTNPNPSWATSGYVSSPTNYQVASAAPYRSPAQSHATPYTYSTNTQAATTSYTYMNPQEHHHHSNHHVHVSPMNPSAYIPSYEIADTSRSDHHHRAASPFGRSAAHVPPPAYTPPPISPTSPEESSTIKKKRKRADARQLKVLNETYNRTAFPSTEERLALAKELDMSPRSVQIWFQNKRQSMRQTNRQSSTLGSSSQPFPVSGQEPLLEDLDSVQLGYNPNSLASVADAQYSSRHSPDASRSHSTSHRRLRHNEEPAERRWF